MTSSASKLKKLWGFFLHFKVCFVQLRWSTIWKFVARCTFWSLGNQCGSMWTGWAFEDFFSASCPESFIFYEFQAENLVLTLRDLFQVVFEMKKREMEEAKRRKESTEKSPDESIASLSSDQTADNLANVRTNTASFTLLPSLPEYMFLNSLCLFHIWLSLVINSVRVKNKAGTQIYCDFRNIMALQHILTLKKGRNWNCLSKFGPTAFAI